MLVLKSLRKIGVLLLILFTIGGMSQSRSDSLLQELKKNPRNANLLNRISESLAETNPRASDSLASIALINANLEENILEQARSLSNIANAAWGVRDFCRAMEFAEKAADAYQQLYEPLESARYLNDAALAAHELDQYEKSLLYYRKRSIFCWRLVTRKTSLRC